MAKLPWYSNYKRALSDDPEVAADYAASITDLSAFDSDEPSMSEWDLWRDLRADIADLIHEQTVALVSAQIEKGKPRPKFKPVDRPVSAMSKALKAREKELEGQLELDFFNKLGR